jgi:ribosome-associated protein
MSQRAINAGLLASELTFTTSRSSGPGGQNVNKVNSKVTLYFDVENSAILTPEEKTTLLAKASSRITGGNILMINAQESRSQNDNKELAINKFDEVLKKAFAKKKARKPTKPSKGSKKKRLDTKKQHSEKKRSRQKPDV